MSEATEHDLLEQEARIRQLLVDTWLKLAERTLRQLDSVKREQDVRLAPLTLLATGVGAAAALMTAGAALFGGALAFLKWIGS